MAPNRMDTSFPTNNKSSDCIEIEALRSSLMSCLPADLTFQFSTLWFFYFFFGLFFLLLVFPEEWNIDQSGHSWTSHEREDQTPFGNIPLYSIRLFFLKNYHIFVLESAKKRVGGFIPRSFLIGAFWDFFLTLPHPCYFMPELWSKIQMSVNKLL